MGISFSGSGPAVALSGLPGHRATWLFWTEELGINLPVPDMKVVPHRFDAFRFPVRKVGRLPDILLQIVEVDAAVLKAFDELVVTLSDRSTGKPALV